MNKLIRGILIVVAIVSAANIVCFIINDRLLLLEINIVLSFSTAAATALLILRNN